MQSAGCAVYTQHNTTMQCNTMWGTEYEVYRATTMWGGVKRLKGASVWEGNVGTLPTPCPITPSLSPGQSR